MEAALRDGIMRHVRRSRLIASLAHWPVAGQPVSPASSEWLKHSGIPVGHLHGHLGGVPTNLECQGILLLFDATTEFAGNVTRSVKQGSIHADQVGLEADTDWQRLQVRHLPGQRRLPGGQGC